MDLTGNNTVLMVYRTAQINIKRCQITPYIVFTYSNRVPKSHQKRIQQSSLSPLYKHHAQNAVCKTVALTYVIRTAQSFLRS